MTTSTITQALFIEGPHRAIVQEEAKRFQKDEFQARQYFMSY